MKQIPYSHVFTKKKNDTSVQETMKGFPQCQMFGQRWAIAWLRNRR